VLQTYPGYNTCMQKAVKTLKTQFPWLKMREIEGVLYLRASKPDIAIEEFVTATALPRETLVNLIKAAKSLGETVFEGADFRPFDPDLITFDSGKVEEIVFKVEAARKTIHKNPVRDLDQFYATSETSAAKMLLVDKIGILDGAKVALLGDDDLLSVAFSSLSSDLESVTTFDVDRELLAGINTACADLGMKCIHTVEYDVKNPLSKPYFGQYDIVITDPPYTRTGITLFLNRAVELLKPVQNHDGYIFLYYGTSIKTPEKTLKIQEIINRMNLVIEHRITNFARYNGAEGIGNTSSVYVLKTTPFTKPLNTFVDYSKLYTHQIQKEEKFPYVDHFVFKIKGVNKGLLESKSGLLRSLGEFCREHKLKVVDEKITKFKNQGLTITLVLSNSNLVAHTWPELGALHVDLITCSPIYDKEHLLESVSRIFGTKLVEITQVE